MTVQDLLAYFGETNNSEIFIFDFKKQGLIYDGAVSKILTENVEEYQRIKALKVDSLDIEINEYFTIYV